jgi:DNA-binding transcriptional LysR family regulator
MAFTPLNALNAFISVARRRSYAAAAKDLGVSASALSQSVRQLERRKKTWRVPVRGPVMTNDAGLCRSLALAGVGLHYALEPTVADELSRGELRVVLEPYAPQVPGLFLDYPARAPRSLPR